MRPFCPRDVVLANVFVLELMADLQRYHCEPERVPNAEDSESENEEVNDRLEGIFCSPGNSQNCLYKIV